MVQRAGLRPIRRLMEQLDQKSSGIAGIGLRVEGLLQGRERLRVVHEVDLHAPDIDRAYALVLQPLDGGDRFGLGGEIQALAFRIHGPRPGQPLAGPRIGTPAFHPADGGQQMVGDDRAALGRLDRGLAQQARLTRGLRRLGTGGDNQAEEAEARQEAAHRPDPRAAGRTALPENDADPDGSSVAGAAPSIWAAPDRHGFRSTNVKKEFQCR